jgi:hypothetical protein
MAMRTATERRIRTAVTEPAEKLVVGSQFKEFSRGDGQLRCGTEAFSRNCPGWQSEEGVAW